MKRLILAVDMGVDVVARVLNLYPRIYFACHRRHVRDDVSGKHVSAHQVSILDHLDADTPTMLSDLADHMGVTSATMSIAIGRLVGQGYVTRVLDPADLTTASVGATVRSLLDEPAWADRSRAIAAEIAAMPDATAALREIEAIAS